MSRLANALRGETGYDYTILRPCGEKMHLHFARIHAASLAQAVSRIADKHPRMVINSIRPAEAGVCIKLLLAYPSRAARWIWNYREMRRVELQAVDAMLRIQTRQAVLREVDNGRETLWVKIPTDAAQAFVTPADPTEDAVGGGDAIGGNDVHGGTLADPNAGSKPTSNTGGSEA